MEREVIARVRDCEVGLAWPTVILAFGILAAWISFIVAAAVGAIPLWAAALANTFLAYLAYTPAHESAHGNVAGGRLSWLNYVVGLTAIFPLLHNISLHRLTHLSHHRHLNDPALDADHWVAGERWWSVAGRCFTLVFSHYRIGLRIADRRSLALGLAENAASLSVMIAVAFAAGWGVAFFTILMPAVLGMALLGFLFDYAVHAPYLFNQRFAATRAYLLPARWHRIGSALWMQQNYHLAHHLYPWIPFYRYSRVFDAARPLIERRGGMIVQL